MCKDKSNDRRDSSSHGRSDREREIGFFPSYPSSFFFFHDSNPSSQLFTFLIHQATLLLASGSPVNVKRNDGKVELDLTGDKPTLKKLMMYGCKVPYSPFSSIPDFCQPELSTIHSPAALKNLDLDEEEVFFVSAPDGKSHFRADK